MRIQMVVDHFIPSGFVPIIRSLPTACVKGAIII